MVILKEYGVWYPFQKIDEIYASLKGSKVFSTLDMCNGYHHVKMNEEARPKTVFTLPTNLGKWEFLHFPFGLAQAPAYFQFLGLVSYYRKFIPHYADIARPLNALIRKDTEFEWTEICQRSFELLMAMVSEELILV